MASLTTAYNELSITTQSPAKLVVMMYDRAVRYLTQAIDAMDAKDFATKGKLLSQTVEIITALDSCMDMEAGGQITKNLRSLYDFMIRHVSQANATCDVKKVQDVIGLIDTLRSAFVQIGETTPTPAEQKDAETPLIQTNA